MYLRPMFRAKVRKKCHDFSTEISILQLKNCIVLYRPVIVMTLRFLMSQFVV